MIILMLLPTMALLTTRYFLSIKPISPPQGIDSSAEGK